jgi:GT2 family glycosyltransferase/SAM-dependent methyltransferase
MSTDPLQLFGLHLPAGAILAPLASGPAGPFWQADPLPAAADYADGLEDLIADYNQQAPGQLAAWAQRHPLTSEQRFILEYNTSADRANVLRTLPLAVSDRVLEVGCGCGPVSQYLWSRAQTLSLEASVARARAAAHRLASHDNPHGSALLCADFHQLGGDAGFDWVIFNGVLEYAAIYSGTQEASPYAAMLKKALHLLKPGGRCVVTIENRLGLKYFAGAPEDHYGRPAVGLEGYRTLAAARAAIRTFSRSEISGLCQEAGLDAPCFLYPFPDYKFTKVVVPDDPASWQFAARRLIETSPAWRGAREHHFDEVSVFRSLAEEKLAGEFAHSFLVIAGKPGPAPTPMAERVHYFPLRRRPELSVGAVFFPEKGEVRRQLLSGGSLDVPPTLPAQAPGNPRAGFVPPAPVAGHAATAQPLSAVPTLWEELRLHIGPSTDTPADYEARLGAGLRASHDLYLAGLPLALAGSWEDFTSKLRAEFTRGGLAEPAAGALRFLEQQQAFATDSLAGIRPGPWCLWAPDWIMENLFPAPDGQGVRLFDVEYVDLAACLPTPALVYRQLRTLQTRTAHPAHARHWPWPATQLKHGTSAVDLPSPPAQWASESLWGHLPPAERDRHAWFWTKVAEVVECAMIGTVVAPFTRAYETTPWLRKLSAELEPISGKPLAQAKITVATRGPAALPVAPADATADELIVKEQEINLQRATANERLALIDQLNSANAERLAERLEVIEGLQATAAERLEVIQKLDVALTQSRRTLAELGHDPTKASPDLTALTDEVSMLRVQLAETRRQLQGKQAQLRKLELSGGALAGAEKSLRQRLLARWQGRLATSTPHPLGLLSQHAPRPLKQERFPRVPRLREWPRICIATPSYQQAQFLERTMLSVLDQGYPNLAYGVQDGGSTDGSVDIITRHLPRLTHAESAPDHGQADAIRRGFAKLFPTTHDIMGWLNSDDVLMPGTLHYIGDYFARHPEVDVIYGHRVIIDEQDREIGRWFLPRHHADTLKWFDLVPQETLFWRARCYQEIGGLDESFQFALDWDLLLRLEQAGCVIRRLPRFLGCFRSHSEQKTSAKIQSVGEKEMARLRLRTHEREVPAWEIHKHLAAEIQRSAMVEWLHRHGMRH